MMQPLKFQIDPLSDFRDWKITEPFQQKVKIEGLNLFICGLQAIHPTYGEVVGSGANLGEFPQHQAWFELVERMVTVESFQRKTFPFRDPISAEKLGMMPSEKVFIQELHPDQKKPEFHFAKSNGIALHTSWPEACRRACYELVERHLVLASWLGYLPPNDVPLRQSYLQALQGVYDIRAFELGWQGIDCLSQSIYVSGIALLPRNAKAPLVLGFGAGAGPLESLQKAESETLQRLGFLWGEELPISEPAFHPTPLYHQEYYLFPGNRHKVEEWLAGKHLHHCPKNRTFPEILQVKFVDLSLDDFHNFKVAKAISSQAIPLVFGRWRQGEFGSLPEDRIIHPIA